MARHHPTAQSALSPRGVPNRRARYLDALKAVRAAEKALRAARKVERQTLREANERIAKARAKA